MKSSKKAYALRVDEVQFEKLRLIAEASHRSLNSQIEFLIAECITQYEKANGSLPVESEQSE